MSSPISLLKRAVRSLLRRYHRLRGSLDVRYNYRTRLVNVSEFSETVRRGLEFLRDARSSDEIGDYLEFGVAHGTSMICVNKELEAAGLSHVRLFGFDSFEGLPHDDEGYWRRGSFDSDIDYTRQLMTEGGIDWSRTELIQGWFGDTLNSETVRYHELTNVSVVTIDCDLYSATRDALEFCHPLLDDVSIIIFDDWNPLAKENKGEKRAFDEFLAEHPQFDAEPFGEYSFEPGDLHGKLFAVRRI